MSSNNPFKNLFAAILDKVSSPIVSDLFLPETRQGDKHYENRARHFIGKDGHYGGVTKDNFKSHFGKEWTNQETYDKGANTKSGPTLGEFMDK